MTPLEPETPTSSEPPSPPRNSLGIDNDTENDSVFDDCANDNLTQRKNELSSQTKHSENFDIQDISTASEDQQTRNGSLAKSRTDR